jgi:hypothetical protein
LYSISEDFDRFTKDVNRDFGTDAPARSMRPTTPF